MDFSIRSLQNIKAESKSQKKQLDNANRHNDKMGMVIEAVRKIMESKDRDQMNEAEIFKLL